MQNKLVYHNAAVAAGQTTITPSGYVDTQGYERCTFVVVWGAITGSGVQSIEVHQCDTTGGSYAALLGSDVAAADDDDNTITTCEIYRPQERYLKCVVNRATQDSAVQCILAILSNQAGSFLTSTTVTASEVHESPAEGTA